MKKKEETPKPTEDQKAKQVKGPPTSVEVGDAGSMDKIRDLLFGNQVRDIERRFSRMEENLRRSATDLHDVVFKRLEALERYFREELEALKSNLKGETEKRLEADKHLQDELKNSVAELTAAIEKTEEKLSERSTELRQQILQQSKDLSSSMQSKYEQAENALNQATDRLDEKKIDRAVLAEYLVDIAMRLSDHPDEQDTDDANA